MNFFFGKITCTSRSLRKNDMFIDRPTGEKMVEPKRETTSPGPGDETEAIQKEATALAWFLDKSTDNVASFVKKLKVNRTAVRASAIDVVYHEHFPDYRGVPKVRGAWFNNAYKKYIQPHMVIAPEIERWMHNPTSWTEIEDALRQEAKKIRESTGGTHSSTSVSHVTCDAEKGDCAPLSGSHSHDSDNARRLLGSQENNACTPSGETRMIDQPLRSDEERKARRNAARRVREQLWQSGVVIIGRDGKDGLEIDTEHQCGCPLYRQKGLRRHCAHCVPDLSWDQDVRALIASILNT